MISYRPAKFVDHRHCGNGDMILAVEGQSSTDSRLNLPLLFIPKAHGMEAHDMQCLELVVRANSNNK